VLLRDKTQEAGKDAEDEQRRKIDKWMRLLQFLGASGCDKALNIKQTYFFS
jgi:hypothetical protein